MSQIQIDMESDNVETVEVNVHVVKDLLPLIPSYLSKALDSVQQRVLSRELPEAYVVIKIAYPEGE